MNKFFAMLKDSYREAIDGWIFTVMLIISGIVTLLVFSISYRPLPAEQALSKIIPELRTINDPPPLQMVSPERGEGTKLHVFGFNAYVRDVAVTPKGGNPWQDDVTFRLNITSTGQGSVEVGADKQPKKFDINNFFRDPFQEAVRTWATLAGGEKPAYSTDLAAEFVKFQLTSVTRLNVTSVTKIKNDNAADFQVTASGASSPLAWPHKPSLFFGAVPMSFLEAPLGQLIHLIENSLVNTLGAWVLLMAGVIVTAGFVPNMLRKGAIDLLLTKPLSRPAILLYKYIGGLLFVLVLAAVTYGGIWLAIGLRTGVWAPGILYCVFSVTFYFAILYACSTLFGVLTRNALVSIVVTVVFWFLIWVIGTVHNTLTVLDNLQIEGRPPRPAAQKKADDSKPQPPAEAVEEEPAEGGPPKPPRTLVQVFDVLNTFTPRTKDLDTLTGNLVTRGLLSDGEQRREGMKLRSLAWGEVLGVAGGYLVLFLGLALLRFVTRSY